MPNIIDLRKPKLAPEKEPLEIKRTKERPVFKAIEKPETKPEIKQEIKEETPKAKTESIEWQVPAQATSKKGYLFGFSALLLIGAFGLIFFKIDMLLATLLILAVMVIVLNSTKKPEELKILINPLGVAINDTERQYKEFKSFWIEYSATGVKELSLESKKWYLPYLKILLGDQNPIEIRNLLIKFLPEKEHEKSLLEEIIRKTGI